MTSFAVSIPNLPQLRAALADSPAIAAPILQNAIVAAQATLAKFTTGATVPIKTGYLVQNWGFDIGTLIARWYPKASYAPYVEFGTKAHEIRPVKARVLANKETGQFFGTLVHHPGTKANPFMERIVASAQPEIDMLFGQALEKIIAQIATQGNA